MFNVNSDIPEAVFQDIIAEAKSQMADGESRGEAIHGAASEFGYYLSDEGFDEISRELEN